MYGVNICFCLSFYSGFVPLSYHRVQSDNALDQELKSLAFTGTLLCNEMCRTVTVTSL